MNAPLSVQSVVVAVKDQVSCDLGGEAAILNLKNGRYYGLDPVGARIWFLLQHKQSVGRVRDVLVSEFDVEPERCENDLMVLLEKLRAAGLIEVENRKTS